MVDRDTAQPSRHAFAFRQPRWKMHLTNGRNSGPQPTRLGLVLSRVHVRG